MGACGVHDQRDSWHAATWRAEPPQRIEAADPLHGEVLEYGGVPHDQADQVVDHGQDGQLLQHARDSFTVQHLHPHRGLEVRQRGLDLPTLAVPFGEVGPTVDVRVEARGHQRELAGAEAWAADVVAHVSEHQGLGQGRSGLPGEPCGTGRRLQPRHQLVIAAERFEPAGPWHAVDGRCPPPTRPDQGPTGVTSTICRAPTRSTACTPAWTRRPRWASAHRPRSATSTASGCQLGWTTGTRARSWVSRGATTSLRSTPVPAWNRPSRRATGTPHPGLAGRGIGPGTPRAIDPTRARALPPPVV
jgi:hypothetical protein